MSGRRPGFWPVWRVPLLLAALTMFGLLAALLGSGPWHWVAWAALLTPVVCALWLGFFKDRTFR